MSERTSELETMIADAVAVSNAFSEYAERLRKESGNNLVVIPADELAALREQVATLTRERDDLRTLQKATWSMLKLCRRAVPVEYHDDLDVLIRALQAKE